MKQEQRSQINFINWVDFNLPDIAEDVHHFANERKCSVIEGRMLKRMGVRRGVLDIFVAIPRHGAIGLWIELKEGKNKPTAEQLTFAERKISNGYIVEFCWSWQDAVFVLLDYLELPKDMLKSE